MKKLYFSLFLLFCFIAAEAQWTQFTSPNLEGGNLNGMITLNGAVYIATGGGVFKTTDNGQNWTTLNNGFTWSLGCQIAKLNDTVYCLQSRKIKKLVNNSWVATPMTHLPSNGLNSWVNDLGYNGNKLFAIAQNNGKYMLFSSSDGKSWNDSTNLGSLFINNYRLYSINDKYVYILNQFHRDSLMYSSSAEKVKKIRNSGLGSPVNYDNPVLSSLPLKDTLYYISKADNKIFKYYESDSSWHQLPLVGLPSSGQIMSLVVSDHYLFVGFFGLGVELYRSSDYGESCAAISNPIPGYPFPIFNYMIQTGGTGVLSEYVAFHAFNDFYYSGNNGDQWTKRNSGFLSLDCSDLSKSGTNLFVSREPYGVIRTNDQGNTWNYANTGLPDFYTLYSPEFVFDHRDKAYIFCAKSINNDSLDLYKFNNQSSTWQKEQSTISFNAATSAGETDSLSFILSKGINPGYYIFSAGLNPKLKNINNSVSMLNLAANYGFVGKGNDSIFIFGRNNQWKKIIYLSTDTAGSWIPTKWNDTLNEYFVQFENWGNNNHPKAALTVGGPDKRMILMARDFTNILSFNAIIFYMFRASDSSWVNIVPTGITNSQFINATLFTYSDNAWYLFTSTGAFKSTDYCQTWTPFKNVQNYPLIDPVAMEVINNEMFIGTSGSSMWRADGFINIVDKDEPENSTLVYPNPTKGNLKIEFKEFLTEPAYVKVYKSSGTLVFSGKYQQVKIIDLDMSDFDSGVYFIKIQNGYNLSDQKVMLIK